MTEAPVILGVAALNVCFTIVGSAILAVSLRWERARSWPTYAPMALLVGAGGCGVILELLVLLGLRADLPTFATSAIVLSVAGLLTARSLGEPLRRELTLGPPKNEIRRPSTTEGVLSTAFCCLATVAGLLILVGSLRTAPWLDDSWTFWIPKGLFLGNLGLDPRMFTPNLHYAVLTHRAYPVWWSITTNLVLQFTGHIDLRAVTGELAVLTLAFAGTVARMLTGRVRPTFVWLAIALLLLSPEVAHQTQAGGADLVLASFLTLFVLCALGWVVEGRLTAVLLAGLFGSAALATKVEALPEFGICATMVCLLAWHLQRSALRTLLYAIGGALLTFAPWFAWAQFRAGSEARGDYGSGLNISLGHVLTSDARIGPAARALGSQLLSPDHWLLIIPLMLLFCVVVAVHDRRVVWLTPVGAMAAFFMFLVWIFWSDTGSLASYLGTTAYRVVVPIAILSDAVLPIAMDRALAATRRWDVAIAGLSSAGVAAAVVGVISTQLPTGATAATIGGLPPPRPGSIRGTLVRGWPFPGQIPLGWLSSDGLKPVVANLTKVAGARRSNLVSPPCLTALTGPSAFAYQLIGPLLTLPPGSYGVTVAAQIGSGGLAVGLLDSSRDRWLATENYTAASTQTRAVVLGGQVRIMHSVRARVVLSNMKPGGGASTWRVCGVRIVATRGGG